MSRGKLHMFYGEPNARLEVDVMFFDCLENLPMPKLSSSLDEVLEWNKDVGNEALQSTSNFTYKHLQDHGSIIVFHSWSAKAKSDITRSYETYEMVKKKEWMGMNRMHLTSAVDKIKMRNSFQFF